MSRPCTPEHMVHTWDRTVGFSGGSSGNQVDGTSSLSGSRGSRVALQHIEREHMPCPAGRSRGHELCGGRFNLRMRD